MGADLAEPHEFTINGCVWKVITTLPVHFCKILKEPLTHGSLYLLRHHDCVWIGQSVPALCHVIKSQTGICVQASSLY